MAKAKTSITTLDTRTGEQKAVDSAMSSWITKYLPGFTPGVPYTGTFTAGMSGQEASSLDYLQQYLDSPGYGDLMKSAANELTTTLNGGYDPATSPFYKSMRDAAMQEQTDARDTMNQQLGARGKYFSSEALKEERELGTRTTNYLQGILGQLSESERARRLNAVPQAVAVDQAMSPLNKVAAAQQYGQLPRLLEQDQLTREYQDFIRQREEAALPVSAGGRFQTQPLQTVVSTSGGGFNWGGLLGQLGGAAAGSLLGPAGTAIGAQAGGWLANLFK